MISCEHFVSRALFSSLPTASLDVPSGSKYCPTAKIMSSAKQPRGAYLGEVFHNYKRMLTRKVEKVNISIIVDESPDVLGVLTLNKLLCCSDADKKGQVTYLMNMTHLKAFNSLTIGTTLISMLIEYGRSWNDVSHCH